MNTLSEETPRVKSSGSSGGKNRRRAIDITTSGKSSGAKVNSVPKYLRPSTGSCHDFCKYGRRHEHVKSATVVNKEKVVKTVVPVKKTTTAKPSPVTVIRDVSAGSNAGIKKKEIKTVKKAEVTPKMGPAKKPIPKATLTDSRSQNASVTRPESLKAKQVAALKDQYRMQKSEARQTSFDEALFAWDSSLELKDGKSEFEVNIDSIEFDLIYSSVELKDPPACDSSLVKIEALDGFETKPEVKHETMEFDFIHPSMELVHPPVCNEFEPFSCNDIGEEESFITYTVNERSELILDEELHENSKQLHEESVYESSHASSEKEVSKEESLIAPPVSESTEDEGVLESSDNEKEVAAAQNDEMETTAGVHDKDRRKGRGVVSQDKDDKGVKLKFRRGKVLDIQSENNNSTSVILKHQAEQEKKVAQFLLNNIIEETASKLAESKKSKVKALVDAFETVIYLSKTANPPLCNEENGRFFQY